MQAPAVSPVAERMEVNGVSLAYKEHGRGSPVDRGALVKPCVVLGPGAVGSNTGKVQRRVRTGRT